MQFQLGPFCFGIRRGGEVPFPGELVIYPGSVHRVTEEEAEAISFQDSLQRLM